MDNHFDFVVIGAGIAGASVAARLAPYARVALVEMESQPGYHSTGRSAATWIENYGNDVIVKLNRASYEFLRQPPDNFECDSVISDRGLLWLHAPDTDVDFDDMIGVGVTEIDADQACARVGALNKNSLSRYAYEDQALDIDVARLHQAHLKMLRKSGGKVFLNHPVTSLSRVQGVWRVESTGNATLSAPIVVNAAGAWADTVARMAGARECTLIPKRRSAAIIPVPDAWLGESDTWPITVDSTERFYFRPEKGTLMLSPADETPVEPHDVFADDMAIAEAAQAFGELMQFQVTRVTHTWAGLRTFAPDGSPVVGMDDVDGFFWLAGQGGYGIQTSPGMARLASGLLLGNQMHESLVSVGFDPADVAPQRFAGTL